MLKGFPIKTAFFLCLVLFVLSSAFTVDQRQTAVIFQFGEAMRVVKEPGLHFKIPFIQKTLFFDNRIINIDAEAKEVTASDGKRIIVDAFAKFKVVDTVNFYKTVNNLQGIKIRLNKILESEMRKVIGRVELTQLLSSSRRGIIEQIRDNVNIEAKKFGIDVIDVQILRADLPKENSAAIYSRMQTEREKEARQIRAEGQEEADRISSRADKESKIILADAYMKSEIIKGEGDATAAKIFNDAFSKDPDFYNFYRHLQTYKITFQDGETTFMLSPDSEFLEYLKIGK